MNTMERDQSEILNVSININQSLDVVWDAWNDEKQMHCWMFISDEYEVKNPRNELKIGGSFSYRMVSGKGGFDFEYSGTYTEIELNKFIAFTMNDGRRTEVVFSVIEDIVRVEIQFESVNEQDVDVQINGWQTMLTNFKLHVESTLSYSSSGSRTV